MRALIAVALCAACGSDEDAPPNRGAVSIYSATHEESGVALSDGVASAFFETPTGAPCVGEPVGDCMFYFCTGTASFQSAGDITVTGASSPITLTPGTGDYVYDPLQLGALFSGGETLAVRASGDDVPAFTSSVTAPARVTLTSPASLVIDRSQDLHVTWTGSSDGDVELQLSGPDEGTLNCRFPASAGAGDIPASALARITAGDGELYANTIVEDTVDAGDWRVLIQASYGIVLADQSLVSFADATYQ